MLCMACFQCLNTNFVGGTNTILDICLILSTIYIFIHVSGCEDRGPSTLLCPGPMMLLRRPCSHLLETGFVVLF